MRHPILPIGFFLLILPCLSFAAANNNTTTAPVATQNPEIMPTTTDDSLNLTKTKTTPNNPESDIPDMPDTPDNTDVLDGD